MTANQRIDAIEVEVEGFAPVDLYERREKIFTRFVGGFYQRLRFFTGWPLLLGYYLIPWINWQGRQAVLFDLPARQFHIFGTTFWPEDLWLLGWVLIIAAFGLFTVTTMVGRLWCGYTCPQTVWTAIFMWIEQVTEGSRNQRIKLDAAPMSFSKLRKRTFKHGMWLGMAFLTGLAFVGYFTPIRELWLSLLQLDAHGWSLFWVVFFTTATYINAGWLREQVCIYMCPYARFQSAMLDKDTLVVSYDAARGEPRGLQKRSAAIAAARLSGGVPGVIGDCIDCSLCVQVCPTGIDIRNGLQYQCIGCAHCIDACNQVMNKLNRDPGLIRYTTEHALSGGTTHWLRGRSIGYALATLVMAMLFVFAVLSRAPLSVEITRDRGAMFHLQDDGSVTNDYSLKVTNKTSKALTIETTLSSPSALTLAATAALTLGARESEYRTVQVFSGANVPSTMQSTPMALQICAYDPAASTDSPVHCIMEQSRFFRPSPMPKGPR
ncbi:MAG: cytochrome c oxidase accessory protein CcoG [Pseudomonadales bacterium]